MVARTRGWGWRWRGEMCLGALGDGWEGYQERGGAHLCAICTGLVNNFRYSCLRTQSISTIGAIPRLTCTLAARHGSPQRLSPSCPLSQPRSTPPSRPTISFVPYRQSTTPSSSATRCRLYRPVALPHRLLPSHILAQVPQSLSSPATNSTPSLPT